MMAIRFYISEAIHQLLCYKLRAFLAILGILVGTASVVAMISIGKLAEQQILNQFEQMGINLLAVSIMPKHYGDNTPMAGLSFADARHVDSVSANIAQVAPYILQYQASRFDNTMLNASTVGITPAIFSLAKLKLQSGRLLSFLDTYDYYALIGYQLALDIKKKTGATSLLGKQITVGNNVFTIVGILQQWPTNFFFQTDFNSSILIPIATALKSQKNAAISSIAVRIHDIAQLSATKDSLTRYINAHTVQQRVNIQSPKSLIDSMKQSAQTMTLLLALIGSISLIVGGIGVMNIMLVSVIERRREIGIRMAIGARPCDIQRQFLIESVVLTVFGGVIGAIIGIVITFGVSLYSHWQFTFFLFPPMIGCLVSILIGTFFGYYPAQKASKLDPIEALRSD